MEGKNHRLLCKIEILNPRANKEEKIQREIDIRIIVSYIDFQILTFSRNSQITENSKRPNILNNSNSKSKTKIQNLNLKLTLYLFLKNLELKF